MQNCGQKLLLQDALNGIMRICFRNEMVRIKDGIQI